MKTIIKYEDYGLEKQQAANVDLAFAEKIEERKAITEMYKQIIKKDISKETANEARQLRLVAVKLKTGIAKIHKTQKEFALAFGKYCDAWKRKETEPTQQIIDKMLEIEKFEERMEAERLKELQAQRVLQIEKYFPDVKERDLSGMDIDVWESFLQTKKTAWENEQTAIAKAEAEKLASEIAEAKERERIKKENEKLKVESEKAAKLEAERAKKAAAERAAYEAKIKVEAEKAAKLEAEIQAKKAAEVAKLAKIEAEKKAAKLAPDKEKLKKLAQTIINIEMPFLQDKNANIILKNIKILLAKTEKYILDESAKL